VIGDIEDRAGDLTTQCSQATRLGFDAFAIHVEHRYARAGF
jgi:hypothetical protein